jgi:cytochrome c553
LSDRAEAAAFRAAAFLAAVVLACPGMDAARAAEAPPGVASCSGCHPANGNAGTPVPRLAGQDAGAIVAAMQAFRSGTRPATVMDRIAKGFSDEEVKAIAAWFMTQP